MPVQANIGVQTVGTIGWDGTASFPMDTRKFIRFGWVFEVTGVIAADAVFRVQYANPLPADQCNPGPFQNATATGNCAVTPAAGSFAEVTIPAGTPVGTVCSGTIPCKPGAFMQVVPVSGTTANVKVVNLRQGPKM